jgi:hypothetical protein
MTYSKKDAEGTESVNFNSNGFKNAYRQVVEDIVIPADNAENLIAQVLQDLPENLQDVPPAFLQVDPEEIAKVIKKKAEEQGSTYKVKPGTAVTQDLLSDLDRLKDKMGGAPNYTGGIPTLNDDDANRTFMGQPLSAVKDWFRMTLKNEWIPKAFWTSVAKLFNVTDNVTQYENAHVRIQRFGLVLANKDRIFEILDSKDPEQYIEFSNITGLAWHPGDNDPGIEKYFINMMNDFLTDYYLDAKAKGEDALIEYFNAYDGVCFEDRAKKIEKYMETHPLASMEAEKGIDLAGLDPDDLADWNENTLVIQVLYQEIKELTAIKGESPTPKELWDHLVKKEVVGREFPNNDDVKVKITADFLNSDAVREELIDITMVLEDGPKIIDQPKDLADVADWNENTSILEVIFQECKEFFVINEGRSPNPQELWDRLVLKGVAGVELPVATGSDQKVALTADYLNDDARREELIDDLMVLDEGPKIVVKATASPDEPAVSNDNDKEEELDEAVGHGLR